MIVAHPVLDRTVSHPPTDPQHVPVPFIRVEQQVFLSPGTRLLLLTGFDPPENAFSRIGRQHGIQKTVRIGTVVAPKLFFDPDHSPRSDNTPGIQGDEQFSAMPLDLLL